MKVKLTVSIVLTIFSGCARIDESHVFQTKPMSKVSTAESSSGAIDIDDGVAKHGLNFVAYQFPSYKLRQTRPGAPVRITYSFKAAPFGSISLLDGPLVGGLSPAAIRQIVEASLAEWVAVVPIHFVEVDDSVEEPDLRFEKNNTGAALGSATSGYVMISNRYGFNETTLKRTVIHEIGHVLGLDHSNDGSAVMARANVRTSLTPDDVNGVISLFGAGVGKVYSYALFGGKIGPFLSIPESDPRSLLLEWSKTRLTSDGRPENYEKKGAYAVFIEVKEPGQKFRTLDVQSSLFKTNYRIQNLKPNIAYTFRVGLPLNDSILYTNEVTGILTSDGPSIPGLPKFVPTSFADRVVSLSFDQLKFEHLSWIDQSSQGSFMFVRSKYETKATKVLQTTDSERLVHTKTMSVSNAANYDHRTLVIATSLSDVGSRIYIVGIRPDETKFSVLNTIRMAGRISRPEIVRLKGALGLAWIEYGASNTLVTAVVDQSGNFIENPTKQPVVDPLAVSAGSSQLEFFSVAVTCKEGAGSKIILLLRGAASPQAFRIVPVFSSPDHQMRIKMSMFADTIVHSRMLNGVEIVEELFFYLDRNNVLNLNRSFIGPAGDYSVRIDTESTGSLVATYSKNMFSWNTSRSLSLVSAPNPSSLDPRLVSFVAKTRLPMGIAWRAGDVFTGVPRYCSLVANAWECKNVSRPPSSVTIGHPVATWGTFSSQSSISLFIPYVDGENNSNVAIEEVAK